MSHNNNLPVQGLNFDEIKASLQTFLKGKPEYKDWNFEGSGISTLLNILSYDAHYIGYYVKMMMDESFTDSAHTRDALLALAKRTGYLPKGKRASRVGVKLKATLDISDDPISRDLLIKHGTSFTGANTQKDSRIYNVVDSVLMYDRLVDGTKVTYSSPSFLAYEGTMETYKFLVDGDNNNQKFVIRDANIDITTLRVEVLPHKGSTDKTVFKLADDIFEINGSSHVFFVTTDQNGYYQIFFGDNIFGVKPNDGNVVQCRYVSTSGEAGNGAKALTFNGDSSSFPVSATFESVVTDISSGGMEPESIDSLRFSIPNHYRRQNRIVTESDYKSVLLSEFRNIESLNVWGGEKNGVRQYGKVFVSVKPKFADSLTAAARDQIKDSVINKYGAVGVDIVFVDPQFVEVDLTVHGVIDLQKTNDSLKILEGKVSDRVKEYNATKLGSFQSNLSDVDLLDFVKQDEPSIVSVYTTKFLRKKKELIRTSTIINVVDFSNSIQPGVKSSAVIYGGRSCYLQDNVQGELWLLDRLTNERVLDNKSGDVDYDAGLVSFTLPTFSYLEGYKGLYSGLIEFKVQPQIPDIRTSNNNIVRIAEIKASLTA